MEKKVKRVLGIPIFTVKTKEYCEKRYFLGIQYKVKPIKRFIQFDQVLSKHVPWLSGRQVKVILNNLGEAVVYARTAAFWYKPHMLVLASKPQNADIFKMFAPEVPVFYFGRGFLKEPIEDKNGNQIDAVLFDERLIEINDRGEHFYKAWENLLKADFSKLTYQKATISEEIQKTALRKAETLDLDLEKFVLLLPEANSVDPLPESFWKDIEDGLRAKGFGVFYNNPMLFTIPEFYVLASKAQAIIALRSGFCDALCELEVPQHVIYGHNIFHGDLQPMYELSQFPWSAKEFIREYNILKQPVEEVKQRILEQVAGM
jgi:hypothetical protein